MITKIIFIFLISIFRIITIQAQEKIEKEDFKHNPFIYNQEHFREISQNYWKKEIVNFKGSYEIVGNSNDTIRLESLDISDININIPQFFLTIPKDGDYTILLNLIAVIFNENSQTAFFDLNNQTSAFVFSISNTGKVSKDGDRTIQIVGHSQNFSQNFNFKLLKDYLDKNPNTLIFTINQLNVNNKNNLELWGIKNDKLILLAFEENKIEELDGEKFYQENYIIEEIDKIQAICN